MMKTLDDVHVCANWIEARITTVCYRYHMQGEAKNKEYRARQALHLLMYRLPPEGREMLTLMAQEMTTEGEWEVVTDYIIAMANEYAKDKRNINIARKWLINDEK